MKIISDIEHILYEGLILILLFLIALELEGTQPTIWILFIFIIITLAKNIQTLES